MKGARKQELERSGGVWKDLGIGWLGQRQTDDTAVREGNCVAWSCYNELVFSRHNE